MDLGLIGLAALIGLAYLIVRGFAVQSSKAN